MIGIGALVGVGLILLDATLGAMKQAAHSAARRRHRHLPADVGDLRGGRRRGDRRTGTTARARDASNPERAERLGTLVASGLIVGESLWGVLNAGLIVGFNSDAPIALVAEDFAPARILAILAFVGSVALLYSWMVKKARRG